MSVESSVVIWQGSTKDIEFSYTDFKGNKSRRNVTVNKVLFDSDSQNFYINGICKERSAERDFKESNISTMIKVGANRYDFQEWMLTLDVDICEWLNSENDKAVNQQSASSTVKKPSLMSKLDEHNRKQQNKLDELKAERTKNPKKTNKPAGNAKGCLGLVAFVMIFSVVMASCDSSESSAPQNVSKIESIKQPEVEVISQKESLSTQSPFDGLSDCQMAGIMFVDLKSMVDNLIFYINNNPSTNDLHFYNWRNDHGFEDQRNAFTNQYPNNFKLSMEQSKATYNLEFAIGQFSRDIHRQLKNAPNQPLSVNAQYNQIVDIFTQISDVCEPEWAKYR